jgi:hypothetical protein
MKIAISFALLFVGVAHAQSPELSDSQKKAATEMAAEVRAGCLKGAEESASIQPPPGFPEWGKVVLKSQTDPGFCVCVQRKFVDSLTPAFFEMSQQQKQLHALNVMQDSECSVAATKSYFSKACEGFVRASIDPDQKGVKLNELAAKRGFADTQALTSNVCTCMREKIRPITPTQWMERTKAAFAPRADGKKGPPNQIGKTPIEQALADCTS